MAAGLYWVHARQPYSEPEHTIGQLFTAARAADLPAFQAATDAGFYASFVRFFGEQKYAEVTALYNRADQLAYPKWRTYRQQANSQASLYYSVLRGQVRTLGREAFNRLDVDRRMELLDDNDGFERFLFDAGVSALSERERAAIPDPEAFRSGQNYGAFVEREGFALLPEADRKVVGSAAALSEAPVPEKLAFFDRVGMPMLRPAEKTRLGSIKRAELDDPDGFKFKYGEPLAKEYLEKAGIPVLERVEGCRYHREDFEGRLFRGELATCTLTLPMGGRPPTDLQLSLRKHDARWAVVGIAPELYTIAWK